MLGRSAGVLHSRPEIIINRHAYIYFLERKKRRADEVRQVESFLGASTFEPYKFARLFQLPGGSYLLLERAGAAGVPRSLS